MPYRTGTAQPAGRTARRLLAAPLAVVAGGSLATVLLVSGASAASVPGPQPGTTPGAVSYETPNPHPCACEVDLYYAGADRAAWSQDVTFGPGSTPNSAGGRLVGGPAPVWTQAGVLGSASTAIFGRGTDNALWWADPATGQPWTSLGGNITSKPSVISNGTGGTIGSIVAFARGTDQAVWYTFRSPAGWQNWTKVGGKLYPGTAPAAVYVGSTIYVVVVGTDRQMYVNETSDGARWSGWFVLGGKASSAASDPAATAPTSSEGVAFVRGTDNSVWFLEFTGGTEPGYWHSLGGQVTSGVGAVTEPAGGGIDLFALGTDNKVWQDSGTLPELSGWTPDQ